jgi:hypothetical protein
MANSFIVRLSLSQWSARKMDKAATAKARTDANASAKAGVKVYKTILAADELEAVARIASAAGQEHRRRTVPWNYEGVGAITAEGYPAYKAAMAGYEKAFFKAVSDFMVVYESEREEARSYLGNMFNAADYPTSIDLGAKFAFTTAVEPMPNAAAFNPHGLDPELVKEIKQDIVENNVAALEKANAVGWSRVLESVEKLKLRLQEYNGGHITKFYDSWLSNISELADMVPSINVADDPDLARIGQRLLSLTAYSNADLKEDEDLRKACIKQAGEILGQIGECYQKAA